MGRVLIESCRMRARLIWREEARRGESWCTAGGAELAIKLGECLLNVNEGKLRN